MMFKTMLILFLSKKQVKKNRRGSEIMVRMPQRKEILEYKDCIRSKMNSILAQKQSIEMMIDNAISDFPLDRDLRIMSRELQSMFGQEDTSTGDVVNNETQIQLFETPKRPAKGSKKRMKKDSRDLEKSPDSTTGMQIVPGATLVDSPIWNSPRTHMELDNSFISYAKKMQHKNSDIPKFDLGISPYKTVQIPQPLSYIPAFKKSLFSLNSQVEAICDAPKASRRDANLGESLRSPY
ncbi:hypothetical protein Ccrd_013784 [Cynara cardunculus var. scolymus]|uniref:Uncharacterized protein n=1 Tax=Cynara cardunculus var. scolymus TaxID=59895 RepID=A0A103YEX9_CYNCS|nr:hypothetical protein Ccrd_013784 [Cynara cardunculus var. scolymus]